MFIKINVARNNKIYVIFRARIRFGLNTVIPKLLIPQLAKETQIFHPKIRRLIKSFFVFSSQDFVIVKWWRCIQMQLSIFTRIVI